MLFVLVPGLDSQGIERHIQEGIDERHRESRISNQRDIQIHCRTAHLVVAVVYRIRQRVHGDADKEIDLLLVHKVRDNRLFELSELIDMFLFIYAHVRNAQAVEEFTRSAGRIDRIAARYEPFDGIEHVCPLLRTADSEEDILLRNPHSHGQHRLRLDRRSASG